MGLKKILIVDYCEEICIMLAEVLSPTYDCLYTSNSEQAFEMISSIVPDLIILDYKMPGLMGVDVCRLIRANESIYRDSYLSSASVQ